MKKLFPGLIISLLIINQAFSQRTLTGRVAADDKPSGLAGASVQIRGQSNSATTDNSGNYSLVIPEDGGLLTVSIDGYRTQQIEVSFQESVDVMMIRIPDESDQISVGYGSQSREELTSSVSQIDSESISGQPLVGLEQAVQGKASGVFVSNNGGKLGQGTTVRIRGGSSLVGSNDPLYVVDGIPLTSGNQSEINPNNIASMQILKDASATAIYGSRAANGVILITTKKGESGKLKVDVDYQIGLSQRPKTLDLMSPKNYNEMLVEYTLRLTGFGDPADGVITRDRLEQWAESGTASFSIGTTDYDIGFPILDSLTYDTDWQDEVFRNALSHRANINLSGGNENHRFFTGIGYTNQEGILIGNDYERLNADFNLNSQFSSQLSTTIGISYVNSTNNRLNDDQDLGSPMQAIALPSSDSYDPANNYQLRVRSLEYNPLTEVNFSDYVETNNRFIGNAGIKYVLDESISFNVDGGIDYVDGKTERRQGPETQTGNPTGFSRIADFTNFNYLINGYLNYSNTVGGNPLNVVLGSSYQKSNSDFAFRSARVNSIQELENKTSGDGFINNPIPSTGYAFLSYFTRINYSIDQKYNFQVSARYDGSSKFGEDNRWGVFPALSAGWTISNESFLEGNSTISFLKLKGSYGIVGNTPEDDFLYVTNYFTIGYGSETGLRIANLANEDLKWESTAQLDAGLEFGLLNDRISGSMNYYMKNTSDLLFPTPVSQTSGQSEAITNVGSLEISGFEIELTTLNVASENVNWTTSFNISTVNNTITDLGGEGRTLIVEQNAYLENQSPGVFYLPVYVGPDPANGKSQWEDGSGGTTTNYDQDLLDNGRQVVGDPNPSLFGGLISTLSFFNFDFSFQLQMVQGVDKYNRTGEFLANSGILLLGQRADQVNRWIEPGDNVPYSVIEPSAENTNPSSRWIEDGSFIRLNNLQLSYNLPGEMIGNMGLRYFTVYIGGQNLFTITDYNGYDPDTNYVDPELGGIGQNITRGVDDFTAPQPRVFMSGIKIGF